VGRPVGKNDLGDLDIHEGMTLKWNYMKLNEEARTGLLCFGIGTGGEGL